MDMETKLTEQFASNDAIDVVASALMLLPGGAEALESAVAALHSDKETVK